MTDSSQNHSGYLTGQFLVAMPSMTDPRFQRTVIYLCVHNAEGAMGLVVNRLVDSLTFDELLEQLNIGRPRGGDEIRVHFGGPVESGRGFVLHSTEYMREGTVVMDNGIGLTATVDILRDIAGGTGPRDSLLALGYAGWGPGQLDGEIQENAWLTVPADADLLFDAELDDKWDRAVGILGFDPKLLSMESGRA
ncbi:MAG: YqgE/AlgH family protein [Alphaproteobacteria bacterium]|jgi:putative transcriptional regulator|uniref:YqgE/AlgH family protein n=1 Tax=Pacificispira sp. TaxID=2888761 RepID=UPI001B160BB1|nr:YqgE/AlgH family protein [Alphaproteobacteria bacterium]MBO6861465.1 YqgE/AlgH family protein [Alphaproteobacteria bacterium]MEC9265404.1 YqgE/AlgH family protein [Pseudomonadota bacterium]